MTRILIIGASGGIGLQAVRSALARRYDVRAFSRSADRIAIDDPRLETSAGNARSASDVSAALAGVDVVIQTLGVAADPGRLFKSIDLFSTATRILLPEMERAGVRRLISVTGFGAGDSAAHVGHLQSIPFRLLLGRAYDDKSIQERLIVDSGLDWTIARPVILTNGPTTDRVQALVDPDSWHWGLISRADVAEFLIGQVEDTRFIGKSVVLTT
ncbi:MAG: NAD(P)H-binding protein [Hyphomicrobiales bacterium]|nr:NAD(P)H-binding protein [Hyphomicrobiales bacterium]